MDLQKIRAAIDKLRPEFAIRENLQNAVHLARNHHNNYFYGLPFNSYHKIMQLLPNLRKSHNLDEMILARQKYHEFVNKHGHGDILHRSTCPGMFSDKLYNATIKYVAGQTIISENTIPSSPDYIGSGWLLQNNPFEKSDYIYHVNKPSTHFVIDNSKIHTPLYILPCGLIFMTIRARCESARGRFGKTKEDSMYLVDIIRDISHDKSVGYIHYEPIPYFDAVGIFDDFGRFYEMTEDEYWALGMSEFIVHFSCFYLRD